MRVLLIDDDPQDRALARRALERELPGVAIEELDRDAAPERAELEVERARLLASEREARAAAETASLTKDHFLATLSHELRTPLNAIVGWARLLRAGALQGQKVERALESIERNAHAQARLIDDLLDVSAIISGKMSLELRPVELGPFLDAALDAVRPAAEARSLRLERQVEPGVGPVLGDPDRLQQVIGNLLSNGVKFTPPGGRVRACLERRGERAAIVVSDTGPGIDPAFLPHLFEPFRQGNRAERSQKGQGLGLAIVRRLVELHGGTVHAESRGLGQGASFVVELPLADSAAAPAAGPREAPAREGAPR
ncbi:MAG TPA: HAMP domain-containing sensor histidine kinase, partial [Thermoanaerobaculia bacterium]|nr:HAMP domain-containing sensor histidine kinase [Thermoanaerobaculia bacterium]